MTRASSLRALPILHETIDTRMDELSELHGDRLRCRRGCSDCCRDNLTVHEVEAAYIESYVAADRQHALRGESPAPLGVCAFLDSDGACRIYPARPYVCRTQGPPIRWLERGVEHRDICPLNENAEPITSLPAEACWTIGPVEERLALLQSLRPTGAEPTRVSLRELFARLSG